ncbi:hypothetical protein EG68_06126 [Paragonimus skrjabini miyazakii]|uniref:Uncharacterized protein n=1 Tax=Paragonimus skrjabini miyazakii TaxID=59628 RepID=A0A8S9YNG2_9TREM|nr:hypothetical protein EG68_06126 [Paragonimus skrjabini miyazakii]
MVDQQDARVVYSFHAWHIINLAIFSFGVFVNLILVVILTRFRKATESLMTTVEFSNIWMTKDKILTPTTKLANENSFSTCLNVLHLKSSFRHFKLKQCQERITVILFKNRFRNW